MDQRSNRIEPWLLPLILLVSLALNLSGIRYGQPLHFDQSVDSIHPTYSLDAIDHWNGERNLAGLKYPRLHFLVLGAVQEAYVRGCLGDQGEQQRDAMMAQFQGRQVLAQIALRESFRPIADLIGALIVVGRVVSAMMGTLLVLAMFLLARELAGSRAGWIAAALTAVSYPLVYYAHTLNVDVPYLAWGALALFASARAARVGGRGWLVAAAVLAAFSVATKDQAGAWFVLPAPLVLYLFTRPTGLGGEQGRRPFPLASVVAALVVATVLFLLAHGLPFDAQGVRLHFEHIFGDGVQPYRKFDLSFAGEWMLLGESLLHLIDGLGAPLLVASLVGAAAWGATRPAAAAMCLAPAVSYYALFVAPIGYVYLRFMLPVLLALIVVAAWLVAALSRVRGVRWVVWVALLALLVERGQRSVQVVRMLTQDPRDAAYRWFEEHLETGDVAAVVAELPLHNLHFPTPEQAVFLDPTAAAPNFGDAPPTYLVVSTFDAQRELFPRPIAAAEPSVRQFAHVYELAATFAPAYEHPLRYGASFQPTVRVYRRGPRIDEVPP